MVIFIILGIAADNTFIYFDAWEQSEMIEVLGGNTRLRIAYAYKRSTKAIVVTSLTTTIAFAANLSSPIMPIKAFGCYAAILIPVNFMLVSFLLPPMLVFYEANLKHRKICGTPK